MWICLNDAFLSIIDPAGEYGGGGAKGSQLLVRARFAGDIERVFPGASVTETPERDYLFRATIPRERVVAEISKAITRIDYFNFKGSVAEKDRHDTYLRLWSVMSNAQEDARMTGRGRRRGRGSRFTGSDLFDTRY